MFERHKYESKEAVPAAGARRLPPDFDDLLDRLAQCAEQRRAMQNTDPVRTD